jgi:hypothetical protein
MRLSGIVVLFAALTVPAVPAMPQTKTGVAPASRVKPTATKAKAAKAKRPAEAVVTAARVSEPVIELPVDGRIVLGNTLKTRLHALLAGTTMSYDEATSGWRNHTQLVRAMSAASDQRLPFPAIHHEVVANRMYVVDAVATVRGAMAPPLTAQ